MKFSFVENPESLLNLTVYEYANNSQTERKITNFIRQHLDTFLSLADVEQAVTNELARLAAIDKRIGQLSSHTWTYCRMKAGNFKALSLSSKRRKGFLMIKENWRLSTRTGQQN